MLLGLEMDLLPHGHIRLSKHACRYHTHLVKGVASQLSPFAQEFVSGCMQLHGPAKSLQLAQMSPGLTECRLVCER